MAQLGYVIGKENLDKTIKRYFTEFKFKHPTPNDFIRVAEKVSGAELDWYLTDWTQTTNTIDYGIKSVSEEDKTNKVVLERIGLMPMPLDILVSYKDGSQEAFYIPLQMMRADKANPNKEVKRTVLKDWAWANPNYEFEVNSTKSIKSVTIDPSKLMADINTDDNIFEVK
jgi:aminopeptidase N